MRFPFEKIIPGLALMVGLSILGSANKAEAAFQLKYEQSSFGDLLIDWTDAGQGTTDPVTGDKRITFSGTYGTFDVTGTFASTNEPGSASVAKLGIVSVTIKNLSTATKTLTISMSADQFTDPLEPLPLTLTSTAAGSLTGRVVGTSTTSGSASGNFTSYIGTGLFNMGTASGPVTFNVTGQGKSFGGDGTPTTLFSAPSTPFSLTNVGVYTLGRQSVITFTGGGTQLLPAAVPEPATMATALLGLPMVGLGIWMRRRKQND